MSLTSHLDDPVHSPIGRFFRQRFAQTSRLTKDCNRQLRQIAPLLPPTHPWPYSHIGMAIDYRIRYSFAITPSHDLVAWLGAWKLLKFADSLKMAKLVHERTGQDTFVIRSEAYDATGGPFYSFDVISAFFQSLEHVLERTQPIGRLLEERDEHELAQYCFLLGLLEEPFRSHRYREGFLMVPSPRRSLEELLAIPLDPWIDDLCALFKLFYDRCHPLLARPHILNPTFAGSSDVGGADADFIVDGCLIDIKTTKQSAVEANWLRQIAGYLLLDYQDSYQIRQVGLYMTRHGLLLSWPVDLFLQTMTGDPSASVAALRQEFRALIASIK
jgi:hypothetical protein